MSTKYRPGPRPHSARRAWSRAGFRLRERSAVSVFGDAKILDGRELHVQMLDCDAEFLSGGRSVLPDVAARRTRDSGFGILGFVRAGDGELPGSLACLKASCLRALVLTPDRPVLPTRRIPIPESTLDSPSASEPAPRGGTAASCDRGSPRSIASCWSPCRPPSQSGTRRAAPRGGPTALALAASVSAATVSSSK